MLVADKYRLHRQIGWSDEAEVHSGPPDAAHGGVPLAVKIRHGMGGPPRPDGNRARFLRAIEEQKAAAEAGCRQVAPIFETGHEGDNAFYVTRHYQRSLDSLIQGRVSLDAAALHRVTDGVLKALEELRDRSGRSHGNLKPTNIFLDGKSVRSASVVLSDLALRDTVTNGEGADCYGLGAALFQLVRGRSIRHFDWPIVPGEDWLKLGPQANSWREFCNLLMSPETSANPAALAAARDAFRHMRRLGAAAVKKARAAGGSGRIAEEGNVPAPPRRKGLLASIGAGIAAITAAGAVLLQPPDSKWGKQLRSVAALAPVLRLVDGAVRPAGLPAPTPPPNDVPPVSGPSPTPNLAQVSPTPDGQMDTGPTPPLTGTPAEAQPSPTVAAATPLPENPGEKWIGYTALLQRFQQEVRDPASAEQPEVLTNDLSRLKDNISYSQVKDEPTVAAFVKELPPKIEATGDQPDLPASLWKKDSVNRQDDVQTAVYQWGATAFRFAFVRVSPQGGNSPAFYLSATAVPVQFGVALAAMAEKDGKGPLSGAASVKGPVAWESAGGRYGLRTSWMVLDSVNAAYYSDKGRPAADSPMNGLSAIEAARLARAAGCALPTLAQWNATLASPSGQQWVSDWQARAHVRGPQWSAFAKGIDSKHITGAKLPNDQCFGDRSDLNAVAQNGDSTLFFEGVGNRALGGFAHLIGNVGQYLTDDARNPSKYYFAGGSAEAASSAFQSLTSPPAVVSPFLTAADGGLRLAIAAKGNGSEKNNALDKLKADLDNELARVQKL